MGQPWRDTSRSRIIRTASVPAPIGGLNARDSIAAMPTTDALILRNWFPLPYAVSMRKGYQEIAVGMTPGETPTVATYSSTLGVDTSVVFTGHNIYVIAAPGVAPAPVVTGTANDYWQTTMCNPAGMPYLVMVNGADSPRAYDGTTFTTPVITPPAGETLDPKTFIHVALHQRRLWFVQKDSMQAWYLPVDQIAGEAAVFPVGQLFKFGGYIMAIYTWSLDSGDGLDDKLVFVTSKGEIAVYSGTNPDSATEWGLEGVFRLGSPVGRRCGVSFGGDLLLLTTDGVVPLSKSFLSTKVNTAANLTDKIKSTISTLVSQYKDRVGWMMMLFQSENQAWLVVPSLTFNVNTQLFDTPYVQIYSMNTISAAWSQFTDMDIRCCSLVYDYPVFVTGDGRLCRAWIGYRDNVPWNYTVGSDISSGQRINIEVLTAYNYFEALGQTKRWTLCRPIFQTGTFPTSAIDLEVDFEVTGATPLNVSIPLATDALWDDREAIWDKALWGSEFQRYRRWQSVQGMGYSAALHMLVAQSAETLWIATDFVFELGGTI